jgi:integrase
MHQHNGTAPSGAVCSLAPAQTNIPTPQEGVGRALEAVVSTTGRTLAKKTARTSNVIKMRPPANLAPQAIAPISLADAANAFMIWHTGRANPEKKLDTSQLTRVQFWLDALGHKHLHEITREEIVGYRTWLASRPALKFRRVGKSGGELVETDRTPSPATLNRHIATLASIYKYAHSAGMLSAAVTAPTRGIRRLHEEERGDLYIRTDELEKLVTVGRALDRRWGKFVALLLLAFYTGLRRGDLLSRKWEHLDLEARTIIVGKTKNGDPILQPLPQRVVDELRRLPGTRAREAYVFCNRQPLAVFDFDRLWDKAFEHAGLERRNFHQLRHGFGSALASANTSQATIMKLMGHKSLVASKRYLHLQTEEKRAALERAFG